MEPGTVAIWWVFLGVSVLTTSTLWLWSRYEVLMYSLAAGLACHHKAVPVCWQCGHGTRLHTQPGLGNRARESRGLLHWHVGYTVSADDLVTKGAKASTAMVWTKAMSFFVITMIFNFKKHIGELGFIFCPFKVISRFCLSLVNSIQYHIDVLAQERHNSIANALELRLSCTYPSL